MNYLGDPPLWALPLIIITVIAVLLWGIALALQPLCDYLEKRRESKIKRDIRENTNLSKNRDMTYAEKCYEKARK